MTTSFHTVYQQYRSPLRIAVGFLFRSRENQKERLRKSQEQLHDTRQQLRESLSRERKLQEQLDAQAQQLQTLEGDITRLRDQPIRLPDDPQLPHHCFGPKMISMCCNLAMAVGFRAAEKALKIFWEFFGLDRALPVFETIRTWLMRIGVARLLLGKKKMKDGTVVWFVDHSCKVGTEKVLAILGIRLEDLPPAGEPLKHEDLMTLLVATGESWKREDVAEQYQTLIEEIGAPVAINSDQAVELQEPASALKNGEKTVLVQTDPKHKLANILKSVLGSDERFEQFQKQLGQTRAAIQQTELSHFTPPKQKAKARFMNLQSTMHWAAMVLWHHSPRCSNRSLPTKSKKPLLKSIPKNAPMGPRPNWTNIAIQEESSVQRVQACSPSATIKNPEKTFLTGHPGAPSLRRDPPLPAGGQESPLTFRASLSRITPGQQSVLRSLTIRLEYYCNTSAQCCELRTLVVIRC